MRRSGRRITHASRDRGAGRVSFGELWWALVLVYESMVYVYAARCLMFASRCRLEDTGHGILLGCDGRPDTGNGRIGE